MSKCSVYPLPNQTLDHVEYAEQQFEDHGADLDSAHAVFVGGTFYAHDFKARHPEAEVTVVEYSPIAAYTQEFAAHQLQKGKSPEETLEELFIRFENSQDGVFDTLSPERYDEILSEHQEFTSSEETHTDEELREELFLEPDYKANEKYPGIETDNHEGWNLDKETCIDNHQRALEDPTTQHLLKPLIRYSRSLIGEDYIDEFTEICENTYDRFLEGEGLDREEIRLQLEEFGDRYDSLDAKGALESIIANLESQADKSHQIHAMEEDAYAHITDTVEGRKKVARNKASLGGPLHQEILLEADKLETPDNVIVDDARELSLDGDLLFTNNVFSYFDSTDEVVDTVDDLSTEGEVHLEYGTGLGNNADFPQTVNHFQNEHGAHLTTRV